MSDYSVVVVGGGPVGVTAANLLGLYGVRTLLIEREHDIIDYPRAIGLDDESLRTFQTVDLVDELLRDAIQNVPLRLIDARGRALADMQPAAREFGWYKRNIFMQPVAERILRQGLDRYEHVDMALGTTMTALDQDDAGVTLTVADGTSQTRRIRARYVIGADGGRSTIRNLVGVSLRGTTHPRKWVVVDCANDPVDAPYTALHCDPHRPYVSAHLPYDRRRWEFMLFPGEDGDEMLAPERVRELLSHHVADPAGVDVIRARVYTHHSRIAERFQTGRVLLAGDAAHLMPPWAGQGLNTGLRDVTNLCWKLAAVTDGAAGRSLLETYDSERRPHAQAMIDLSTTLGRVFGATARPVAVARDAVLRAAGRTPALRRWTLEMRFKPPPSYDEGFVSRLRHAESGDLVGRLVPQPQVEDAEGVPRLLDEVLGPWFSLMGFGCDPLAGAPEAVRADLTRLGARVVKVVESRAGAAVRAAQCLDPGTVVVEDVHNLLRPWFARGHARVALVRPDRYVAALVRPGDSWGAVAALIARTFEGVTA